MPEPAASKPGVAVIGLGSMGFGMATSLRRAEFDVTGCDVSVDAVARFVADGGKGAATPADVSIPPSHSNSLIKRTFAPRRAAWMAAAVPLVVPPMTRISVVRDCMEVKVEIDRSL